MTEAVLSASITSRIEAYMHHHRVSLSYQHLQTSTKQLELLPV